MANVKENVPAWQFNVIPGNANQGAILITRNVIGNPPFTQDDFIWIAMEDIIGTADIKLEYDEVANEYKLYKANGHRDNEGNWNYNWELVGTWEPISDDVAEALKALVYVNYRYDTTVPNVLKVYGIRKDSTEDLLCDISFVSLSQFDTAVQTLNNSISAETTRASNRENELQAMIEAATMNPGVAIEVTTNKEINVKVDNDSIKVNGANQLKADVFDDTQVRNDKGWSSAKISQVLVSGVKYQGQVATYDDLPTGYGEAEKGYLYDVLDTGANYIWNGTGWDKQSETYIAGPGIDITDRVISSTGVNFGTGDGLEVEGSGTESVLKVKAGNGFSFGSNKALNLNVGAGLEISSNKLHAKVDNDSIKTNANGELYTDAVMPEEGDGITIDETNKTISVNPATNGGIKVDSNGVAIDGTIEEWVFTLADATTVTKKIAVLN